MKRIILIAFLCGCRDGDRYHSRGLKDNQFYTANGYLAEVVSTKTPERYVGLPGRRFRMAPTNDQVELNDKYRNSVWTVGDEIWADGEAYMTTPEIDPIDDRNWVTSIGIPASSLLNERQWLEVPDERPPPPPVAEPLNLNSGEGLIVPPLPEDGE